LGNEKKVVTKIIKKWLLKYNFSSKKHASNLKNMGTFSTFAVLNSKNQGEMTNILGLKK